MNTGSGTAGGSVHVSVDPSAWIQDIIDAFNGKKGGNAGTGGGDTSLTVNQVVNVQQAVDQAAQSGPTLDAGVLAAIAASADRLEQGMSQLVALAGNDVKGTTAYDALDKELKILRSGSDKLYDFSKQSAAHQQGLDHLLTAFGHKGKFGNWVNDQLQESVSAAQARGLEVSTKEI